MIIVELIQHIIIHQLISISQASPKTLGKDRLALAAAAASEFKNQNTLVLDAGTCLTYEMVNSKNEYLGGDMSDGKQIHLRALNGFTDKGCYCPK